MTNKTITPKNPNVKIINEYARPNMDTNIIFEKNKGKDLVKNEKKGPKQEPKKKV